MAGHCDDTGLFVSHDVALGPKTADSLAGVVTIHKGHVAVHDDESIPAGNSIIDGLLDLVDGLIPIIALLTTLFVVWQLEDHQKALDDITIEFFVINNKDLAHFFDRAQAAHPFGSIVDRVLDDRSRIELTDLILL